MKKINCFKAYDVRGRVPEELDEDIAYRIGRGYAAFVKPRTVAVGYDIRASSPLLMAALVKGLTDSGVDVLDIGVGGTELSYFATFSRNLDGGIMVTASHNPPNYNGMKFVREGSRPISADTGLKDIQELAERNEFGPPAAARGKVRQADVKPEYIEHLLSYVDRRSLAPLKIVVNAGNGGAGPIVDLLEPHLPFRFVKMFHEPDGRFPNGVPNPMIEANRAVTARRLRAERAALGVAWDGDYDRCFFFDEQGQFIEGYYIVGLLAQTFLGKSRGERIVHDPRLTWNTLDLVQQGGGTAVQSKSGHAFIKQRMREVDAVYGGEMSAHHYFRAFSYADSGMIPWLLITEIMSRRGVSLSTLVGERMRAYPASGEINRKVQDAPATIASVKAKYTPGAVAVDYTDGLSVEYRDWRFNLRSSNTEPLLRLNVESRGDEQLMRAKTAELLELLGGEAG
ncbi:MAG TPA: phosphomannomutase [Gammaproteobacteria bacterium]|nr:phosphomannomutase [Gammaproteobacteria bacterium]